MGDSPSSSGGSNTVTQVQQIPEYEQQFSQENQDLARSLASRPAPTYNAPIVADLNSTQVMGLNGAVANAYNYAPQMQQAIGSTIQAGNMDPTKAGDPSQNALYGAQAIANGNPMADATKSVNSFLGNAATSGQQASQTAASAVSGAGQQASTMAQKAASANPVAGTTAAVNALNPANAGVINSYMSPYIQASLAPQLMQAGITQAQQQQGINSQATGANAFGDARQGTQNALQNYYGQQTNAGIEAQGFNTGYTNALNTAIAEQGQQQQLGTLGVNEQNAQTNAANTVLGVGNLGVNAANVQLGAGNLNVNAANARTSLANTGINEQNTMLNQQTSEQNYQKILQQQQMNQLAASKQTADLGQMNQTEALKAANAVYDAGNIQQQNSQSQLTAAYQQYMNQANWPYAMLNMRESAMTNSPYNIATADTVPAPGSTATGLSSFAGLAGALGTLGNSQKIG